MNRTCVITDLHKDAVSAILRAARTGRGYEWHQTRELVYVAALPTITTNQAAALAREIERRSG